MVTAGRMRFVMLVVLVGACRSAQIEPIRLSAAPRTNAERSAPLVYWSEIRTIPEPMAIHVLRVDLQSKAIQVDAVIADDPDGAGPAEAALTNPIELARRANVLAAVNANAFAGLPDSTGKTTHDWHEGMHVNIAGIAAHDGVTRSAGGDGVAVDVTFGVDMTGRPYIGTANSGTSLEEAVNAWSFRMIENGVPIPKPGGVRHPRTAVGVDSTGRWLYIVVVDGRQDGFSVGMTPRELSDLMLRLGAHRAANLDGGGSSIMLVMTDGGLQTVNRPSGGKPRPVPVLLTVRRRSSP
jgi:exopolysaccharide biosynthesis protein